MDAQPFLFAAEKQETGFIYFVFLPVAATGSEEGPAANGRVFRDAIYIISRRMGERKRESLTFCVFSKNWGAC